MYVIIFMLLLIGAVFFVFIFRKKLLKSFLSKKSLQQTQTKESIPIYRNENPIKAPENFSTKTFFESSKAERIIYEYLQKSLSPFYTVIPHVSLTDIFSYSKSENESSSYNIYKFLGYHVDFAVFDKLYYPVMAIELNGGSHRTDRKVIWTDQRKKELFGYFHIPLISLDLSKSYKDGELTQLLRNQIKEDSRIVYCWNCHVPITHPFTECPKCHKSNIHLPVLFIKA